jgi:hypothetical protein
MQGRIQRIQRILPAAKTAVVPRNLAGLRRVGASFGGSPDAGGDPHVGEGKGKVKGKGG